MRSASSSTSTFTAARCTDLAVDQVQQPARRGDQHLHALHADHLRVDGDAHRTRRSRSSPVQAAHVLSSLEHRFHLHRQLARGHQHQHGHVAVLAIAHCSSSKRCEDRQHIGSRSSPNRSSRCPTHPSRRAPPESCLLLDRRGLGCISSRSLPLTKVAIGRVYRSSGRRSPCRGRGSEASAWANVPIACCSSIFRSF
jgi:hypothetical protein